jgi:hypothetical protein
MIRPWTQLLGVHLQLAKLPGVVTACWREEERWATATATPATVRERRGEEETEHVCPL